MHKMSSTNKKEILEKTMLRVQDRFKPHIRGKITHEMVENAVNKASKGFTPDQVVMALRFSKYLCERCGQCCRINNPIAVDLEDLVDIAIYLGVSLDVIIANYTKTLKNGRFSLKTNPCPFLKSNECSIYPARPKICRLFPLQVKEGKLVPMIFEYCNFCKNLIIEKAVSFIFAELIKLMSPELHRKLKGYTKQLQHQLPNDWKEQIEFVDKLLMEKGATKQANH